MLKKPHNLFLIVVFADDDDATPFRSYGNIHTYARRLSRPRPSLEVETVTVTTSHAYHSLTQTFAYFHLALYFRLLQTKPQLAQAKKGVTSPPKKLTSQQSPQLDGSLLLRRRRQSSRSEAGVVRERTLLAHPRNSTTLTRSTTTTLTLRRRVATRTRTGEGRK